MIRFVEERSVLKVPENGLDDGLGAGPHCHVQGGVALLVHVMKLGLLVLANSMWGNEILLTLVPSSRRI